MGQFKRNLHSYFKNNQMTKDNKSYRCSPLAATIHVSAEMLTVSLSIRGWIRPFRNPFLFPKTPAEHPALLADPHAPEFGPYKTKG